MPEQLPATAYEQAIADLRRSLRARPIQAPALGNDAGRVSAAGLVGRRWSRTVEKVFRPAS